MFKRIVAFVALVHRNRPVLVELDLRLVSDSFIFELDHPSGLAERLGDDREPCRKQTRNRFLPAARYEAEKTDHSIGDRSGTTDFVLRSTLDDSPGGDKRGVISLVVIIDHQTD